MARSLNKVQLIGNLTRDPELRYTPNGNAVCTFGVATNRSWTTDSGEKREESDFHRIVAWNKLAEICSQFLTKGRKVYVEGRLSTRNWTAQDGSQKSTTEVVIDDMILLDNKGMGQAAAAPQPVKDEVKEQEETEETTSSVADTKETDETEEKPRKKAQPKKDDPEPKQSDEEEVMPDDIPF